MGRADADYGLLLCYRAAMDCETKRRLFMQHPDESPDIAGMLPYLIHPPSRIARTARWEQFRDRTLLPLIADRPDDPWLPQFLAQTEAVLAWRAALPPEQRFWKAD
jgi:hypothetical protein